MYLLNIEEDKIYQRARYIYYEKEIFESLVTIYEDYDSLDILKKTN